MKNKISNYDACQNGGNAMLNTVPATFSVFRFLFCLSSEKKLSDGNCLLSTETEKKIKPKRKLVCGKEMMSNQN